MIILNIISYLLAAYFIYLAVKSKLYLPKNLIALWNSAKMHFEAKEKIKSEISKAEKKGEKGFKMPDGTVIYAKTQLAAMYKYKLHLQNQKYPSKKTK